MSRPCMCEPGEHPPKDSALTYPGFVWSSLLEEIEYQEWTKAQKIKWLYQPESSTGVEE